VFQQALKFQNNQLKKAKYGIAEPIKETALRPLYVSMGLPPTLHHILSVVQIGSVIEES